MAYAALGRPLEIWQWLDGQRGRGEIGGSFSVPISVRGNVVAADLEIEAKLYSLLATKFGISLSRSLRPFGRI